MQEDFYMKKRMILILVAIFLIGCGKTSEAKVEDLEFTVIAEREIPEELAQVIAEKKESPFQLTFSTPEHLYMVIGYGTQPTGGYSIRVLECYLTENAVVLDTELLGPESAPEGAAEASYPYLVVRTTVREEPVIFR